MMIRIQPLILAITIVSCAVTHSSTSVFKDLVDQEDVTIALSAYGLDSIPAEIGRLKNAKTLTVSQDKLQEWTIRPPLSALNEMIDLPPFRTLPDEITSLGDLTKLSLPDLKIKTLPKDFDQLQNLEYLNLGFNKLIVVDEIDKLMALKKLKFLYLVGNRIDTVEVERWQKERPDLQIKYRAD